MAPPRAAIMVGIDFGTTFSGAAWSWSLMAESGDVVKNWPGLEGQAESAKVPTQIHYEGDKISWGFNIPAGKQPLRWFKLLLLREEDLKAPYIDAAVRTNSYLKEARETLKKLKKDAEDVVADYLSLLWKQVLKSIRSELGNALAGQPIRIVLTYPAIWPPYAQQRMRTAAATAGMLDPRPNVEATTLHLCAEPEAAALAVMHDPNGQTIEGGESFVVCDIGGGTADLITYRLEDTNTYELSEQAAGAGKLCGAFLADAAFDTKIPEWFGEKPWRKLEPEAKAIWKEENWERGLKRRFTGEDEEVGLRIPVELEIMQTINLKFWKKKQTPKVKIQNHQLKLTKAHVEGIFDICVDQIVALVQGQIKNTLQRGNRKPKCVILVGGFGQSPYIQNKIQQAVGPQGIEVCRISGDRGWTAVCRGALNRAAYMHNPVDQGLMRANVGTRVMRASYGIEVIEEFDANRHTAEDRAHVASIGQDMAVKQMDWYIYNNHDISDQDIISRDWSRKVNVPLVRSKFEVKLLRCNLPHPPTRKDATVHEEGIIQCVVDTPFSQLPTYTNANGETWRNIEFNIEMKVSGTMLEFTASYNGRRHRPLHISPPFATEAEALGQEED